MNDSSGQHGWRAVESSADARPGSTAKVYFNRCVIYFGTRSPGSTCSAKLHTSLVDPHVLLRLYNQPTRDAEQQQYVSGVFYCMHTTPICFILGMYILYLNSKKSGAPKGYIHSGGMISPRELSERASIVWGHFVPSLFSAE